MLHASVVAVHHAQIGRATEHHHIFSFRSFHPRGHRLPPLRKVSIRRRTRQAALLEMFTCYRFVSPMQIFGILRGVLRYALWQHPRGRSRRRSRTQARTYSIQAALLPYHRNLLGECPRRSTLPRVEAERHYCQQRCLVHRVCVHRLIESCRLPPQRLFSASKEKVLPILFTRSSDF